MRRLIETLSRARHTLRFRLMLLVAALFVLAACLAGYFVSRHSIHELDEILNANLAQSARSVYAVLSGETEKNTSQLQDIIDRYSNFQSGLPAGLQEHDDELSENEEEALELVGYQRQVYLRLVDVGADIVISSLDYTLELPATAGNGFFTLQEGSHQWVFFGIDDQTRQLRFFMGQRGDYRSELIDEASEGVIAPVLFILPLLVYALWWAIGRGMRPLQELSTEIALRKSDNLADVPQSLATAETRPVVDALNDLLHRLKKTLQSERRFTADASHELRTPIAAMRAQIGVLQSARSESERQVAVAQMDKAAVQMTRLVDDLLSLARLDHEGGVFEMARFDLHQLLVEILADTAVLALDRDIEISLVPDENCEVNSVQRLHYLIITNLLSNAIKFTPVGGQIGIVINNSQGRVSYRVEDTGPGISEHDLKHIAERFYRSRTSSSGTEVDGVGLGLSIALRAAQLLNAELSFRNRDSGGLCAEVTW